MNKKFIISFISVVAIIIIGGIVWVVKNHPSNQANQLEQSNDQVAGDNSQESVVVTSNEDMYVSPKEAQRILINIDIDGTPDELGWLTYRSNMHGYEIRYPKDFFVDLKGGVRFYILEDFSQGLPIMRLLTRETFIDSFPDNNDTPWMSLSQVLEEQRQINNQDFNKQEVFFESDSGVKGFTQYGCFKNDGVGVFSNSIFFTPRSRIEISLSHIEPGWQFTDKEKINDFAMKNCERIVEEEINGIYDQMIVKKMHLIREKMIESINLTQ